ncbi:MAG: hypothetical protein LUE14_02990 [Clostridiales bacterium]|nr:hypothetical protein [Clostridiales bacterium]
MAYKNYIKLDTRLPWRCHYYILDRVEYLADGIFVQNKIPVRFGRREYKKKGTDYCLVDCWFHKKYEGRFLKCMNGLGDKMCLAGYSDYEKFCKELSEHLVAWTAGL